MVPDNSDVIHKMEGRPGISSSRMPFSGPPLLSSGQIEVVSGGLRLAPHDNEAM